MKKFEAAQLEIIRFDGEDVVVASGCHIICSPHTTDTCSAANPFCKVVNAG